jgi:hydroxymethylpyrimidine/phosphomethylpyrimidine kinase
MSTIAVGFAGDTNRSRCRCHYCGETVTLAAHTPRVLSIAGSDSGGGAGIQADLKAFARCGVHGMTAITAITAQSTVGVAAVYEVPPEMVLAQVRTVVADIGVDAVKVGMLGTAPVIRAVARALDELPAGTAVVVDPVMVAESGARLLDIDAQRALVQEMLPRATVLTPNLPEARALVGESTDAGTGPMDAGTGLMETGTGPMDAGTGPMEAGGEHAEAGVGVEPGDAEIERLARAVLALGPGAVVLTGGHRARALDVFVDREDRTGAVEIPGERHLDGAAHGSGCTHSSVLAAQLALGRTPLQAARIARRLAGEAVAHGLRDVGEGAGPVDILDLESLRDLGASGVS